MTKSADMTDRHRRCADPGTGMMSPRSVHIRDFAYTPEKQSRLSLRVQRSLFKQQLQASLQLTIK